MNGYFPNQKGAIRHVNYYFLESQLPKSGFVDGSVAFVPDLETYYSQIRTRLPIDTIAEVLLHSSIRKLKNDYFHTTDGAKVISDAFKILLERQKTDIQFIPAALRYHNGRSVERAYWIAHLPDEVDCFDYERSDYGRKAVIAASVHEPPRKPIKVLFKAYLDTEKVDGREFFMLAHVLALNPIVSEEFYQVCKKNKLKLNVTPL